MTTPPLPLVVLAFSCSFATTEHTGTWSNVVQSRIWRELGENVSKTEGKRFTVTMSCVIMEWGPAKRFGSSRVTRLNVNAWPWNMAFKVKGRASKGGGGTTTTQKTRIQTTYTTFFACTQFGGLMIHWLLGKRHSRQAYPASLPVLMIILNCWYVTTEV